MFIFHREITLSFSLQTLCYVSVKKKNQQNAMPYWMRNWMLTVVWNCHPSVVLRPAAFSPPQFLLERQTNWMKYFIFKKLCWLFVCPGKLGKALVPKVPSSVLLPLVFPQLLPSAFNLLSLAFLDSDCHSWPLALFIQCHLFSQIFHP